MFELTNEFLVMLLLFIIVLSITFNLCLKIFKNKGIALVIGGAVSLLAIFYLSNSQILFVAKSYGLAGSIWLISIPFLIAFFFAYTIDIPGGLRKIFFVFYAIISVMLLQV